MHYIVQSAILSEVCEAYRGENNKGRFNMKEEEQVATPQNDEQVFLELVGNGFRVDEDFIERHLV